MEGKFERQFSFSFEKIVSFNFFINFSNVLPLYFVVFAFPLWRIVVSTKVMQFGDILPES